MGSNEYLERLKLALDATSDALWDWHVPTGKAYFSPRYYTMLGYEAGEFPAGYESWAALLHPEDREETIGKIRQHIESGKDHFSEEFRLRAKSGQWLWILGRGKVIQRDEYGRSVRMVGTHINIDRRKRAEQELALYRNRLEQLVSRRTAELENVNARLRTEIDERRQAQLERENALQQLKQTSSLLEAVFDTIPDVIGIQDGDHRIIRYNAAGYRLLNMTPSEVTGRRCFELLGREAECERCATSAAYSSKAPERVERFEEALDTWLDVRAYPVLDEKGDIVHVIEHLRDITSEKNAEEERLDLLQKLQHAQKMEAIGTLAGGIAHDFNNLLMGILGNVSLLVADIVPQTPEYDKIRNIEEFAKSGAELTKQLLGLARGGRYEVRPTDLAELVGAAADMFGRTKKEIQIHMKFDPVIWTVDVDQAQIKQVALNIFVNAWQAMPGGGNLYVEIENTELGRDFAAPHGVSPGRYVRVAIADTGIGMDPEQIQRIFDPFFTTKAKERGTGLGLASAYGIIKNHGGVITADSRKNKGSTLTLYLPAVGKPVAATTECVRKEIRGSGTILVIDDEAMILAITRQMIERLGYEVLTASGGSEGVEIFRSQSDRIDGVVLDMIMPEMGGEETFTKLKEIRPGIPVLLSSGYSIDDKAQRILDRGCSGFIQKPYNLVELSSKLNEILTGPFPEDPMPVR